LVVPEGVVPGAAVGNLLGGETEEEEIIFAGSFSHFDGSAIKSANGEGAVHHEFHVAGATGLVASGGNLVGDVAGRNEVFGESDAIIREKENAETAADGGIGIDGVGEVVDELDDEFGKLIGGSGFTGEEEGTRRHFEIGIIAKAIIENDDAKSVEELAFVFVDALDVRIEHGIGIDSDVRGGLKPGSKL